MKKTFLRLIRCTVVALAIVLCLVTSFSGSASAQSPSEYYDISHSVQFSKSQVTGTEDFTATVTAEATCIKNFPVSATEASFTSRIVAEHQTSGARVTLNSGYTLTIDPFPNTIGENTTVVRTVTLQFPAGSSSGTYTVIAELVDAKVYVGPIPFPVTSYLTSEEVAGTISYTGSSGGGGGGPAPSKVSVTGMSANNYLMVDNGGIVQEMIRLQVTEVDAFLDIAEGTRILGANGIALKSLTAGEGGELPTTAPGKATLRSVNMGPDGATFTPAITLAMGFNPDALLEGMVAEELYIAF